MIDRTNLESLINLALDQFRTAANNHAKKPEGTALSTSGGINFGGHSYNDTISSGGNALSAIQRHLDIFVKDDIQKKFEIAAIVIATPYDQKTKLPQDPHENTLNDLAEYIGTSDGQIVYVVSPNHDEIRTIKL